MLESSTEKSLQYSFCSSRASPLGSCLSEDATLCFSACVVVDVASAPRISGGSRLVFAKRCFVL